MNIAASDLKHALKKLAPLRTETFQLSEKGVSAQDSDAIVDVLCPFSGLTGALNISGKKLTQVINRMSGQIEITQFDRYIEIKSARAKVDLETQPVQPVVRPELPKYNLEIKLPDFKKALAVASASASTAKSAAFGGVVLFQNLPLGLDETESSGYRVTGTDAVVLTTVTVKTPVSLQFRALINLTACTVVQAMDSETILVGDTNQRLILRDQTTTIYAARPVQKYPDFDALLAMRPHTSFVLKPQEWLSALRTVEPLIDDTVDKGAIGVHFEENVVQFKNVGSGSVGSDEADYEQVDPDPVFDPKVVDLKITEKYLSAFLSRAGEEEATLGVTNSPIRLEAGNVVVLTMPVGEKK